MTPASDDLLLSCLDDVCAGRRTVEHCAAEHPDLRPDLLALSPMLATARHHQDRPPMGEEARLRVRAGLRAAMGVNGHHPAEGKNVLRDVGRKPWLGALFAWPLDRLAFVAAVAGGHAGLLPAIGAGVGAALASGAVVYASQTAPPASPLYPVREAVHAVTQTWAPAPTPTPSRAASPTPMPTAQVAASPTAVIRRVDARHAVVTPDAPGMREREAEGPGPQETPPGLARQQANASPRARGEEERELRLASAAPTVATGGRQGSNSHDGGGTPSPSASSTSGHGGGSHDGGGSPSPSASSSSGDGGSHDGGSSGSGGGH